MSPTSATNTATVAQSANPADTNNQTNQQRRQTMSKYQLNTIQEVLGCDIKQAEHLIQLMDETGDHPDWSEFSTKQFRSHFKMVLAGF
jgi:hypothetical protein